MTGIGTEKRTEVMEHCCDGAPQLSARCRASAERCAARLQRRQRILRVYQRRERARKLLQHHVCQQRALAQHAAGRLGAIRLRKLRRREDGSPAGQWQRAEHLSQERVQQL
jgi:hypothetical protein